MLLSSTIAECLEGLDFPATKKEIIGYAEDRNAPPDLLEALEKMREPVDGSYYSMAGIWDAVGTID